MIDPEHNLSIQKQAEALEISRSTVYYQPRPVSAEDLWLMRRIDELHLNYPFAGRRGQRNVAPSAATSKICPRRCHKHNGHRSIDHRHIKPWVTAISLAVTHVH